MRIPKRYQFDGERVYLKRHGRGLLILPADDPWEGMLEAMGNFPDDVFGDGRDQGTFEQREGF